MGQIMLANQDFHIHAKGVSISKHLNHPAASRPRRCRPIRDGNIDDKAFEVLILLLLCRCLRTQNSIQCFRVLRNLRAKRNQDRLADTRIEWCDKIASHPFAALCSSPICIMKDSYYGWIAALQHP